MAAPSEKLAESLEVLGRLQRNGSVAIRARDLSRTHRERLLRDGFLQEVMKGWYVPSRPDEMPGESTAWYTSFWRFCADYLVSRFGTDWSLSPEQSLLLHADNWTVPPQLLVRSPKGRNKVTPLPHRTSLLDIRAALPAPTEVCERAGLRFFSQEAALVACSPRFFNQHPTDARAVLANLPDASTLLARLLAGGNSTVAGRLAGALRNTGQDRLADEILETMRTAGYDVREQDPFQDHSRQPLPIREKSPYANRIHLLWEQMRGPVLERFPAPPVPPTEIDTFLHRIEESYPADAYHSLSIEGYNVSPELIERVRSGEWNPDRKGADQEHLNALAARGYWQAFLQVKNAVRRVLAGENPGNVAEEEHGRWFRELFAPTVSAGLLRPMDLAGYRSGQVYIRCSMHVPPNPAAVRDAMPVFFELLREEQESSVRAVLGHFLLVYIHPYPDGNGRIGRFLMNVMLAAGGYPWTMVPVGNKSEYLATLEAASVRQDIVPFTEFIAGLVKGRLAGRPIP
ncbi:MAG: Fic family protein [Desulfobulbaceae bacterium]|nr:Fic family protein [Desulfobulbaceae bacterium]